MGQPKREGRSIETIVWPALGVATIGVVIGAASAALFGLLCGGLAGLLDDRFDKPLGWVRWFAICGAIAGGVLGLVAMTDRLRNALYWDAISPRPQKSGRVARSPTPMRNGQAAVADGYGIEPLPKDAPSRRPAESNLRRWML